MIFFEILKYFIPFVKGVIFDGSPPSKKKTVKRWMLIFIIIGSIALNMNVFKMASTIQTLKKQKEKDDPYLIEKNHALSDRVAELSKELEIARADLAGSLETRCVVVSPPGKDKKVLTSVPKYAISPKTIEELNRKFQEGP